MAIDVSLEELKKRTEVERIKDASNYLSGTLVESRLYVKYSG
jgi:hypothetical protein